jgi:hypothetical protein
MAINICIYHVGLNTKCSNNSGQYSIVSEVCHLIVVLLWNISIEKTPLVVNCYLYTKLCHLITKHCIYQFTKLKKITIMLY